MILRMPAAVGPPVGHKSIVIAQGKVYSSSMPKRRVDARDC